MELGSLTDKEIKLIRFLRKHSLPFGEILVRLYYQDDVVVRGVIEDKKESEKF